ncbi:MAG: tetratricopeptide repeat protein [Bacteroidetes bacterium]|nr:tetratricopeptide repeat protein [Bacteroidota bacterium]
MLIKASLLLVTFFLSSSVSAQLPDSLIQHCFEIRYDDAEQASRDCEKGIALARKAGRDSLTARGLIIYGLVKKGESKYQEAIDLYREGIEIRGSLGDTSGMVSGYSNTGAAYEEWGKYDEAISSLLKAKSLVDQIEDKSKLGSVLMNLSNAYSRTGDHLKAIDMLEEAIELFKTQGNNYRTANAYFNLGNRNLDIENPLEAFENYNTAYSIFKDEGDEEDLGNVHNGLGLCYLATKQIDSARHHFQLAIDFFEVFQEERISWSDVYINLYQLEADQNNPTLAKKHLQKAEDILNGEGGLFDHWYLQNAWANLYAQLGQHDSAYYFQQNAIALNDSIYNKEKARAISEMQTKYDVRLKEQEAEVMGALADKRAIQRNTFMIMSGLLLLIGGLIIYLLHQRSKARALISKQKEKLHKQTVEELVRTQEVKVYQSILEGQEKERKRLAAELHDRVGGSLAGLKWQFEALAEDQNGKENELDKTRNLIDQTYKEVRQISHNMAGGTSSSFGLKKAAHDLISAAHRPGKLRASLVTHGLEAELPGEVEEEIYKILQELISNVLKHARASNLSVQIGRFPKHLNLTVEDNGIGFTPEKSDKKGLGLKNIEDRVENLKGEINIDSGRGGGTTVMIDIPL